MGDQREELESGRHHHQETLFDTDRFYVYHEIFRPVLASSLGRTMISVNTVIIAVEDGFIDPNGRATSDK